MARTAAMTLILHLSLVGLGIAQTGETGDAPSEVEAALLALDRAYLEAWEQPGTERQRAALLPLFAENGVIIPGAGLEPRHGRSEIEAFWFPEGSPPTDVRSFEHTDRHVEVHDDLGVVHGRSKLVFEYEGEVTRQEGNFLMVARYRAAQGWRITHLIWNNRTEP